MARRHAWLVTGWLMVAAAMPGVSAAELSKADLMVSDIVPSAVAPEKILVVIRNRGSEAVRRNFAVELWLDEIRVGRQEVSDTIGTDGTPLYVEFKRPKEIAPGLHYLSAKIDPDESLEEASRDNNVKGISIWVKE